MATVYFKSNAAAVRQATEEAIDRILEQWGLDAETYAKDNLKRNRSVDTGNLRNSVTHKRFDSKTEIVGSAVKYAPYVELGHHQQPGRFVPAIKKRLVRKFVPGKPYLRPAVEGHIDHYQEVAERELAKIK